MINPFNSQVVGVFYTKMTFISEPIERLVRKYFNHRGIISHRKKHKQTNKTPHAKTTTHNMVNALIQLSI